MTEQPSFVLGLAGDAAGDHRLSRAIDAALGGVRETGTSTAFVNYAEVGDGFRAACFRSQLVGPARAAMKALEEAAAIVLGVPVERGTIPGQFKHILDLADPDRLRDRPALLIVNRHASDDGDALAAQAVALALGFGLRPVQDPVLIGRANMASDGQVNAETTRHLARAGRLLAMSASGELAPPPAFQPATGRAGVDASRGKLLRPSFGVYASR